MASGGTAPALIGFTGEEISRTIFVSISAQVSPAPNVARQLHGLSLDSVALTSARTASQGSKHVCFASERASHSLPKWRFIMNSSLANLLIAILFFVIGAAVVGLIWYFQSVMKKGRAGSKNSAATGTDQTEIARLIRDNQTQDLVVHMEGNDYKTAHELTPALQRRLGFTSNVLVNWLGAATAQPAAEGEAQSVPDEGNPAEAWQMSDAVVTPESHTEYVPPFATEAATEVKPVSTSLSDVVGGILNPTPAPAPQFKSIAMQINDILPAQLAGTALESRGITVNDAPDHGVMVTVDGAKYPGLKDVPDDEVRKAIRAAVLEWETRK